jgi:putative flippase GtrA
MIKGIMRLISEYKKFIRQFIKFNIVGVSNTLVDFGIFVILNIMGVFYIYAQVISYGCGIMNSYILNRYWTFNYKGISHHFTIFKFLGVNLLSLGISLAFLYIFRDYAGINILASKIISTFFSMTINFFGSKFWVFNIPSG